MGFFDFLKKPKEERPAVVDTKPIEVGIDSLERKINEHVSDTLSREQEDARNLYEKIKKDFRLIKVITKDLERKKFEGHDRTYSAVNMIKNNYVNRTFGLLGGIPIVEEMNQGELENFLAKTTKVIEGMKKVPPKQAVMVSKYFKKEASEIVKIIKRIEDSLEEMRNLLADGKTIPLVSKISSKVGILKGLERKLKDFEQQEKILKEKIKKARKEKDGKEEEMEKLLKSERYKKLVDFKEIIKEMKQEKEKLENEVREEFSLVKRPLKKYEHVLRNDRSIPREKRILFEKMIHSPVKAILSDGGENVSKEMAFHVEEALKKGLIKLKESELKKFEEFSNGVKLGRISNLKKKYDEVKRKLKESEKYKGKGVLNERERIKREIEYFVHEISEYEKNLENLSKGKKSIKVELLEEKEKLEKMIERETGKKFVVKVLQRS